MELPGRCKRVAPLLRAARALSHGVALRKGASGSAKAASTIGLDR
jgi:hypothetical protein